MKSLVKITDDMKYQMFLECKDDVAQQIVGAVLYSLHLKGWRKRRISKAYDDILAVLDMPDLMGKPLGGVEVMDFLTKHYDIDFSKINVKSESQTEMRKRGWKP